MTKIFLLCMVLSCTLTFCYANNQPAPEIQQEHKEKTFADRMNALGSSILPGGLVVGSFYWLCKLAQKALNRSQCTFVADVEWGFTDEDRANHDPYYLNALADAHHQESLTFQIYAWAIIVSAAVIYANYRLKLPQRAFKHLGYALS